MRSTDRALSDKCLSFIQMAIDIHFNYPKTPLESIIKVGLDDFLKDLSQEELDVLHGMPF